MQRLLVLAITIGTLSGTATAQENAAETWLPTLITETPEEGFELAVTLARTGVRLTQPDVEVLRKLRPAYAHDPDSLTAASQVIAIHFQTIAAANDYWRSDESAGGDAGE
jgi:hypothetical protein